MVMNFYSDPVLGMQYFCLHDFPVLVYDISLIPRDFSIDRWLECVKKQGIPIYDISNFVVDPFKEISSIYYNREPTFMDCIS